MKQIDKTNWSHAHSFDFFDGFACPLADFGLDFKAQKLYDKCQKEGTSFFLAFLYGILYSLNQISAFRQRLLSDGSIVEYEKIAVMTPVPLEDDECGLVLLEYADTWESFLRQALPVIEAVKRKDFSKCRPDTQRQDIVVASCLPWFPFTSMTHAKRSYQTDTYPVFSWGKMDENGHINLVVQFDHRFIDGIHIGRFYQNMSAFLES